jgi:hypothetical protein
MTRRQLRLFYNQAQIEASNERKKDTADRLDEHSLTWTGKPSPTAKEIRRGLD